MMEEWLIVDGYNVLGAAETAPFSSLEEARDRLIRRLSEYQAISGRKVILVFDAHRMPGAGTKQVLEQIEVQYTRQRETADERIEKLVRQLRQPGRQIFCRHVGLSRTAVGFRSRGVPDLFPGAAARNGGCPGGAEAGEPDPPNAAKIGLGRTARRGPKTIGALEKEKIGGNLTFL